MAESQMLKGSSRYMNAFAKVSVMPRKGSSGCLARPVKEPFLEERSGQLVSKQATL